MVRWPGDCGRGSDFVPVSFVAPAPAASACGAGFDSAQVLVVEFFARVWIYRCAILQEELGVYADCSGDAIAGELGFLPSRVWMVQVQVSQAEQGLEMVDESRGGGDLLEV